MEKEVKEKEIDLEEKVETVEKNEKEKKKKKQSVVVTILIVLLLVAAFGFGYAVCATNKFNKKTENAESHDSENSGSKNEEEKWEDVSESSFLIEEAKKFNSPKLCGGSNLTLEKRDRDFSELSVTDKLDIAISVGLCGKTETELGTYFKDLSFLDAFKPSYDTCYDYATGAPCHEGAKKDVIIHHPMYVRYIDGRFICEKYGTGCSGPSNEGDYLKFLDAKKNDTTLIVNYVHYYQVPDYDPETDRFGSIIYKEKDDKNPIEVVEGVFDKSKFDGYQFVFDITNGNLQLTKINYLANLE